ncbi:hypothetical protein C1Y12_29015, partial [Pseudomonas sp. FW305-47B]
GGGGGGAHIPVSPLPQPPVTPATPGAVNVSDASGSNNQPILSGSGRPGDTVQILDNGVVIGEVVIGDDGKWSFTPNPPLVDGDHSLTVVIKDPAGNTSEESQPVELVVDTTAPELPAPVIAGQPDGGITVSGRGEPGATVNVTFPDGSTGSVVVDASGNYSIDSPVSVVQPEGDLVINITDSHGNQSPDIVVEYEDTTAPEAPTPAIIGKPDGGVTVSGRGEPGATVNVTFPDGSTGSVVVDASG